MHIRDPRMMRFRRWRQVGCRLAHHRDGQSIPVILAWILIRMSSYQYRKSHCGDKTVVRSSYLHNGISYTGKMTSLYWIRAHDISGSPIESRWGYRVQIFNLTLHTCSSVGLWAGVQSGKCGFLRRPVFESWSRQRETACLLQFEITPPCQYKIKNQQVFMAAYIYNHEVIYIYIIMKLVTLFQQWYFGCM